MRQRNGVALSISVIMASKWQRSGGISAKNSQRSESVSGNIMASAQWQWRGEISAVSKIMA
jgi:hypothetical protein